MTYTFFLDLDGTLIHKERPNPTDTFLHVMSEAQKLGHRFFINTGRPHSNIPKARFRTELFDGICSGCGTRITYREECIYERTLPPEQVFSVAEAVNSARPEIEFMLEGSERVYTASIPWRDYLVKYDSVKELKAASPEIKIQKFASRPGFHIPEEITKPFEADFDVYRHPTFTELVPKGYDKAKAVALVEEKLGIPHESTVAVGDSANDLPMMEYCAVSIAMGNAKDEIKSTCAITADTAENDGAAKAIAKLCGIEY